MAHFTPPAPRLHALIGDAVLELPTPVVVQLEQVLQQPPSAPPTTAFMTRMQHMHYPVAADGTLWDEPGASPERNDTLAQVSRSLRGLDSLLQVLTAGVAQKHDGTAAQLGDGVLLGLLLAGRELVERAADALHQGR